MSRYEAVHKAMAAGTPLELICASCPWDRLCVQPPPLTGAEIEEQIKRAEAKDLARDPRRQSAPAHMLMTALMVGDKDSMGEMCPVFSTRLRSPAGRQVADDIRGLMRGHDDHAGGGA